MKSIARHQPSILMPQSICTHVLEKMTRFR